MAAFLTSLVVLRVNKTVFYFTVCDDDLGVFQFYRCIHIGECAGIQKDRAVFFAHGNCKLIHDSAVASVEVVLRVLSDQCDVCHA